MSLCNCDPNAKERVKAELQAGLAEAEQALLTHRTAEEEALATMQVIRELIAILNGGE